MNFRKVNTVEPLHLDTVDSFNINKKINNETIINKI